jgi:acetoin utilization deacetylase AcuC-like enzyme
MAKKIAFTTVHSPKHRLVGHPENPDRFKYFVHLENLAPSADILEISPALVAEETILKIHLSKLPKWDQDLWIMEILM